MRDNRQEAIGILADWGKTQREDAVAAYDSTWQLFSADGTMPDDGMKLVIDDCQKRHQIDTGGADRRSRRAVH